MYHSIGMAVHDSYSRAGFALADGTTYQGNTVFALQLAKPLN
ncbi:hypothetical protein [Nodosilinea sp. E11]|nr:hypothetical protein [Nodosilinea sp. E11]WOD38803.1 hypothetical protein RRF56_21605 [Nodosilinea sp. E11]